MADQPLGNLDNPAIKARFSHYSRPTQYGRRVNPQVNQGFIDQQPAQQVTQTAAKPINSAPGVNELPSQTNAAVPQQLYREVPVQEPAQQFTAPVYLNNYSGEYEDTKYKRFSMRELRIKKRLILSSSLGVSLLLAGALFFAISWSNSRNIAQAQSSSAGSYSFSGNSSLPTSGSLASSVEPSPNQVASYSVAPNLPKLLIIPKLNISSIITPVGLIGSNYLHAPSNIFNVGWWQNSSLPGQTGAVVLDGFTSNGASSGVFSSLAKLKSGTTFQIEKGDGSILNYQILSISKIGGNGVSMDQAISPVDPSKPSLNIITCSGSNTACPSSNTDVVVFAQQQ